MRRLVAGLVLAGTLLSGCADDAESPDGRLLQPEDLPGVEDTHLDEGSSATKTNCAPMDAEYNLAITGEDDPYVVYTLTGNTRVRSALQSPHLHQESIAHTFDEVSKLIAECVERESGAFEELTGLPDGAIGFRATQDTSEGVQTTERAYGRVNDELAAVVTVVHIGDDRAPVDIGGLSATALDRAIKD